MDTKTFWTFLVTIGLDWTGFEKRMNLASLLATHQSSANGKRPAITEIRIKGAYVQMPRAPLVIPVKRIASVSVITRCAAFVKFKMGS